MKDLYLFIKDGDQTIVHMYCREDLEATLERSREIVEKSYRPTKVEIYTCLGGYTYTLAHTMSTEDYVEVK